MTKNVQIAVSSILLKEACMVHNEKALRHRNDKLIHVPIPSFAKLATFIYRFFNSKYPNSPMAIQ
jgi:hypothetical protein